MAALAAVPSQARVLSRTGGLETSQPRKAVVKLDRARGVLKVYGTAQAIKDIRMCCSVGGRSKHDFQDPFRPQDVERQLECMTGPRKEISRASWAELMRTRTSKRQIIQILLIDVLVSRLGLQSVLVYYQMLLPQRCPMLGPVSPCKDWTSGWGCPPADSEPERLSGAHRAFQK